MLPGLLTPTHLLLLLCAVAVFFGLRKVSTRRPRTARPARRRGTGRIRSLRLRKPTRAQAHVAWLLFSALVAFAVTHAAALPLFLLVFFVVWICGYGVLVRLYR
jgi:hypothetical protein